MKLANIWALLIGRLLNFFYICKAVDDWNICKPTNIIKFSKHIKRLIIKKRKYWKLVHVAKTRLAKNKFIELARKCRLKLNALHYESKMP